MGRSFVQALRTRGIDLTTVQEQGTRGKTDADQLEVATALGRVLYSKNVRDFTRLHAEWVSSGRHHSGIIVASAGAKAQHGIGEQVRLLMNLLTTRTTAEMVDQLEFLSNWR